jgi:hypothetical protein
LGPTDPQLLLQTSTGRRFVAAQALMAQFDMARHDCRDRDNWGAWAPMLPQYGPDLLVTADNACRMTAHLVSKWLTEFMFVGMPKKEANKRSRKLAKLLNDHDRMFTHSRHLGFEELESAGMRVSRLEADNVAQDAVLSAYHATIALFSALPTCVKVIENHLGKAFIKFGGVQQQAMSQPKPPLPTNPPSA